MIYVESKIKVKKSLIEFNQNSLFDLYYRENFDISDYAEMNCKLNYNLKEEDLKNNFYLTLEEIDNVKNELQDMNKKDRIEKLNNFMFENIDNIKLKEELESITLMTIKNSVVNEKLELVSLNTKIENINIEETDFYNIKDDIKKCPFIKEFCDYSFIKTKEGEEYILLKNINDKEYTALTKERIEEMIDKYNEKEFHNSPVADNKELADFENEKEEEYIKHNQNNFELSF